MKEKEILKINPEAKKFIKPFISAKEFINNINRWCLWLVDVDPAEIKSFSKVLERVEGVRNHRIKSDRIATKKLAAYPTLFGEIRQPNGNYILIPRVSSENRKYIPMSFFSSNNIVSDTCLAVPKAKIYHFGILTSEMHMAWVKQVCGRLKSDYRYSNDIVYNNFPWPLNPTVKQIKLVEEKAQKVLDTRKEFSKNSLADLYDPLTMPPALVKAHQELDKVVDLCYRTQPFSNEVKRIEFLFELYEKYTQPLLSEKKLKKKK